MNKSADNFFVNGCGRCSLGSTPQCKVHTWQDVLAYLRDLLKENPDLKEDCKWGFPCYTYNGKNVALLAAFKDFSSINFFKGVLISDPDELLKKAGENTYASRLYKATSVETIHKHESEIKNFIAQAVEIEKSKKEVPPPPKKELEIPQELEEKFEEDPAFEEAFYSLTPGRQRGYVLYFSDAKQSETRKNRIEKYTEHIMRGVGMHDEYKMKKK